MMNTSVNVTKTPAPPAPSPAPAAGADTWSVLRGEMDRLFDRFSAGFFPRATMIPRRLGLEADMLSPAVDIVEDPTAYTLTAELPGLAEKDIDVTISGHRLTIKGEKRQEHEEKNGNVCLTERSYGAFARSFVLPEGISEDKVAATFDKGVLTVTVPKAVREHPKRVEVKPAA